MQMLRQLSAWGRRLFGADDLDPEHERFLRAMTALERQQLETATLTAELEARLDVYEGEQRDAPLV